MTKPLNLIVSDLKQGCLEYDNACSEKLAKHPSLHSTRIEKHARKKKKANGVERLILCLHPIYVIIV